MNLYFLDKENKQHLVVRDVSEEDAIPKMLIDLYNRYPNFKNYYQRVWWDEFHRMWIDYGSHTEFYILQDEKYALNIVDDFECESCKIDIPEQEEEKPSCNRHNRDYCDI